MTKIIWHVDNVSCFVVCPIVVWWCHIASANCFIIGSENGLVLLGAKVLPKPMMMFWQSHHSFSEIWTKYNICYLRKHIWKCRLPYAHHFVQASVLNLRLLDYSIHGLSLGVWLVQSICTENRELSWCQVVIGGPAGLRPDILQVTKKLSFWQFSVLSVWVWLTWQIPLPRKPIERLVPLSDNTTNLFYRDNCLRSGSSQQDRYP